MDADTPLGILDMTVSTQVQRALPKLFLDEGLELVLNATWVCPENGGTATPSQLIARPLESTGIGGAPEKVLIFQPVGGKLRIPSGGSRRLQKRNVSLLYSLFPPADAPLGWFAEASWTSA